MVEYFVIIVSAPQCIARNRQIQIPRPHKQHMLSKKTNQEVAFGKMSHLGGFQIQKAIILSFPIPSWQNSTSVLGQLVHPHKKNLEKECDPPLE